MKNFGFAIFSLALILLFFSCKKQVVAAIDFSTITAENSACEMTGSVDTNSWGRDTALTPAEMALVSFIDTNIKLTEMLPGGVTVSPACPNPSYGVFQLNVFTQRQCEMRVAVVNGDFEILYYQSLKLNGGPVTNKYDFQGLTAFHPNKNYRFYYGFFDARDSMYYQGHGNLLIQ